MVASPQNAGSVGAAAVMAAGLGLISGLDVVRILIPAEARYMPDPGRSAAYQPYYAVFKELYRSNRKNFRALNGAGQ